MAAAGAAPEVLVLADLLIGLVYILSFAVLAGLLWSYRNTFGWLFQRVGSVSVHVPIVGRIHPLAIFLTIDDAFVSALGNAAAKQQRRAGRFFHAAAVVQGWLVRELRDFALETWGWAKWLQHVYVPTYIHGLHLLGKVATTVTHVVTQKVTATTNTVERVVTKRIGLTRGQVDALIRKAVAATGAISVPIPAVFPRIRDLQRDVSNLWKRVRNGERYIGASAAGALLLVALRKLGLSWIRCRNVTSAGKGVCRMDASLLESLLTDGLAILSVLSVVEFANELRAIEDEAVKVLSVGIREWPK